MSQTRRPFWKTLTSRFAPAGRPAPPRRASLRLESLEGRDLPASLSGGLLTVEGTRYDDTIKISQSGGRIWVETSYKAGGIGVTSAESFLAANVSKIKVLGYEGRDYISAYGVNVATELRGGPGNDSLYGGLKDDTIYGQGDNDLIYGNEGNDTLDSGDGDDTLYGYTGDDTLYGGAGNDYLKGNDRRDTLYGNTGNDTLVGTAGADLLNGGAGNDRMEVTLDLDDLIANKGRAIAAADNFQAGNGTDTVVVTIELNSFSRRFLKPATDEISNATFVVQPLLDVLNRPVPVLSRFDGSLTFGSVLRRANPSVGKFIDGVNTIRGFANSVGTWSGQITLGTFTITSGSKAVSTVSANPYGQIDSSALQRLRNAGVSLGLLDNPRSAVRLMLGEAVNLFEVKLPTLNVGASYGNRWDLPTGLWGVYIKAMLTASINLKAGATFGMDSTGIRSGYVLDGLYVRDAFASVSAGLTATGGVAAGIPSWMDLGEVGLRGSMTGTLKFTLTDPNRDGKVHFGELPDFYNDAFRKSGQFDYDVSGYLKYWHILKFKHETTSWSFAHGTFRA
jgi:hypothetical protein